MKTTNSFWVACSTRCYQKLLFLYPSSHRREFGGLMAQLFRDQCQEAYHSAGRLGVINVWLRVLPDLGMTIFQEHLLKHKLSKSMLKLNLRSLVPVWSMIFVLMAALAVSLALAWYWPKENICRAILELNAPGESSSIDLGPGGANREALAKTEMMRLQSQPFLMQVIQELNLTDHYQSILGLKRLSPDETCAILRKHLLVRVLSNTSLLEVSVRDRDRAKAATIANHMAQRYVEKAAELAQMQSHRKIEVLMQRRQDVEMQMKELQSEIKVIQSALNGFDPEAIQRIRLSLLDLRQNQAELELPYSRLTALAPLQLRQMLPGMFPDTVLNELLSNFNKAENELASLRKDYGNEAPQVQKAVKLLETINSQVEDRANGILASMKFRIETSRQLFKDRQESLDQAQQKALENEDRAMALDSKKRELQALQELRKTAQQQIFQGQVELQKSQPPATILESASYPVESILPVLPKRLAGSILLGAALYVVIKLYLAFYSPRQAGARPANV